MSCFIIISPGVCVDTNQIITFVHCKNMITFTFKHHENTQEMLYETEEQALEAYLKLVEKVNGN